MPRAEGLRGETATPSIAARQPRAIHSALTVLETVAALGVGSTAREIAAALGLPRATAYRLLNLLVQEEYLVRTPDLSGFALGNKVVELARAAAPVRVPTAARETLSDLRSRVRGGVHLVLYSESRMVVADADEDFPLSDEVRLLREPERFALGRLPLVDAGREDGALSHAADDLRSWGVTRQVDEVLPGHGCLAMPIRDRDGALFGALGFSGPKHRIEDPRVVIELFRPASERLEMLLT